MRCGEAKLEGFEKTSKNFGLELQAVLKLVYNSRLRSVGLVVARC